MQIGVTVAYIYKESILSLSGSNTKKLNIGIVDVNFFEFVMILDFYRSPTRFNRLVSSLKDAYNIQPDFPVWQWRFAIQNAVQKKENIKIETSNTIVSSNFDVFYGLVFKGSITW